LEQGIGGLRAKDWRRRGVTGRILGGGGCRGARRGGGAEVVFELVAVGGGELDAGWVAAQHWRMIRWRRRRTGSWLVWWSASRAKATPN
jgi:hypothetical protein